MDKKSFHVELLPDEPILLFEVTKEYAVARDWPEGDAEVRKFLDQVNESLYHLIDLTEASFTLDDIVAGVNNLSRGEAALWMHPNIQELIFVTTNITIQMAAKGLNSPMFGSIQAKLFETREEALAYIHVKIAEDL